MKGYYFALSGVIVRRESVVLGYLLLAGNRKEGEEVFCKNSACTNYEDCWKNGFNLEVLFPDYVEEIDRELKSCPRKFVVCDGYPRVENGADADCDDFLRKNGFSCEGCPF